MTLLHERMIPTYLPGVVTAVLKILDVQNQKAKVMQVRSQAASVTHFVAYNSVFWWLYRGNLLSKDWCSFASWVTQNGCSEYPLWPGFRKLLSWKTFLLYVLVFCCVGDSQILRFGRSSWNFLLNNLFIIYLSLLDDLWI